MQELLNYNNITNYERFDAIDGQELKINNPLLRFFDNSFRRGMIGSCLSHYTLWKELTHDSCDHYVILEDDVTFANDFSTNLNNVFEILDSQDIVLLGYSTEPNKEFIKNIYESEDVLIYDLPQTSHILNSSFGYVISKNFANILTSNIEQYGFRRTIDTILLDYDISVVSPILVFNTFKNTDSDVCYDMWGIHDKYKFYCSQDSGGNDKHYFPGKTIEEMKNICSNDPECVAFNTYGFVKTKICDSENFIKLPSNYENNMIHGMFVKC